jgi:hypothetical protein
MLTSREISRAAKIRIYLGDSGEAGVGIRVWNLGVNEEDLDKTGSMGKEDAEENI